MLPIPPAKMKAGIGSNNKTYTLIDEGEVNNLKNICKDLFYKVKVYKWEKLHPFFDKNRKANPNKKIVRYEYIIICFKSKNFVKKSLKRPKDPFTFGNNFHIIVKRCIFY